MLGGEIRKFMHKGRECECCVRGMQNLMKLLLFSTLTEATRGIQD